MVVFLSLSRNIFFYNFISKESKSSFEIASCSANDHFPCRKANSLFTNASFTALTFSALLTTYGAIPFETATCCACFNIVRACVAWLDVLPYVATTDDTLLLAALKSATSALSKAVLNVGILEERSITASVILCFYFLQVKVTFDL